tara:strand:- start:5 stop:457 length:453 start_codon:yes stop_codon:yes gene_type:complete
MLLNLAWLIPGFPIIASFLIGVLLLSFRKTMNRLTKPVSYFIIFSLILSELINFIFLKKDILGIDPILGNGLELVIDKPALIVAESIGIIFILIMLYSVGKLKRRTGYVRYFVSLGFLIGFVYLFSFSGILFHNVYDPLISSLDKIGISF